MKAWRIAQHGGPEVLKREEIATPAPGPMQVRVKVHALGLNHLDVWVRRGVAGHKFPLPITPGCDVAGVIDEFGAGAQESFSELKKGDRVVINPGISCGHCDACLNGFDPICKSYGILGEHRDGGAADFVCVPVQNIIPLPASLSFEEAAALPIPFLTAWNMIFRKTALKSGETILIQAGGSGVSVAAIQIAKMIGATVITTVGSDDKIAKARALGADHVINYKTTPFRDEVKKLAGKKGCDVVLDHVGAETFGESIKCLAWGGRLATCGATSGSDVKIDLKLVFFKNLSILGTTMGSKADLLKVVDLASQKKLKSIVHAKLPMSDLPKALTLLEDRSVFGKIILTQ